MQPIRPCASVSVSADPRWIWPSLFLWTGLSLYVDLVPRKGNHNIRVSSPAHGVTSAFTWHPLHLFSLSHCVDVPRQQSLPTPTHSRQEDGRSRAEQELEKRENPDLLSSCARGKAP